MLKAGRTQTLTVSRLSDYGLYLADDEGQEVLLPNRYVSLTDKPGDTKEVFLYHDSEDRLVATTETPLLRAGEAGFLRVVGKTPPGPLLPLGLPGKGLFLPKRHPPGGGGAAGQRGAVQGEQEITAQKFCFVKFGLSINPPAEGFGGKDSVKGCPAGRFGAQPPQCGGTWRGDEPSGFPFALDQTTF